MTDSLSKIGEQLASTILKAFSKPFADALSESITNAISPVVNKVSGWLSGILGGGSGAASLLTGAVGPSASELQNLVNIGALPASGVVVWRRIWRNASWFSAGVASSIQNSR